jgi:predicted DNA-binding transcriptional regulator AlpA
MVLQDLIDASEVATLLGLSQRNSAATYSQRYPDFPRPVVDTGTRRCRLWLRSDVDRWRRGRAAAGKVRRR